MNAVDAIHEAYTEGATFIGLSDVKVFLESIGFSPMAAKTIDLMERRARYRCAEEGIRIESPTAENNWRRTQLADTQQQEQSRITRLRYSRTHLKNTNTILQADAQAPDASDDMILAAHYVAKANTIMQKMPI